MTTVRKGNCCQASSANHDLVTGASLAMGFRRARPPSYPPNVLIGPSKPKFMVHSFNLVATNWQNGQTGDIVGFQNEGSRW